MVENLVSADPPALEDLSGELCESASWLRCKLTGQVPNDVGGLLRWARLIGSQVWPLVEGLESSQFFHAEQLNLC